MAIYNFTDGEYAVIMDSLTYQRAKIQRDHPGMKTPNIDSALAKMVAWASPAGCDFVVATGEDASLIRDVTEF